MLSARTHAVREVLPAHLACTDPVPDDRERPSIACVRITLRTFFWAGGVDRGWAVIQSLSAIETCTTVGVLRHQYEKKVIT
jgi:hypothetical protein